MIDSWGMLAEWSFSVDIKEDTAQITIKADLLGMAQRDTHVSVDRCRLTIFGESVF
ncbi:MAG: hypothetical protein HQL74_10630 [Magnetococcales bacterium]|nr:hypothetical protein [Magnetococcales bacterium]